MNRVQGVLLFGLPVERPKFKFTIRSSSVFFKGTYGVSVQTAIIRLHKSKTGNCDFSLILFRMP